MPNFCWPGCGERVENDEAQMTNDEGSTNAQMTKKTPHNSSRDSDFVIPSSFNASPARTVRHSSLTRGLISTSEQLNELVSHLDRHERVAVDTEADSLHCYREKLCLLQVSLPEGDFLVDPLVENDLAPLAEKLENQLIERDRFGWFQQSCERAIVLAAIDRERDTEEAWRIRGSGLIRGREAAILRALWHWRDREAERFDRPSFHVLRNDQLIETACAASRGETPQFRH